jgi:putative transposase
MLTVRVFDQPARKPSWVAIDEIAVKINGEWSWLYAAIDLDTRLILDAQSFGCHDTDPAAAFLHGLREKHDLSEAVFLVDGFGYRTALARLGLNGRVEYTDGNLIEQWFHTFKMRVDRFHNSWMGSRRSARTFDDHEKKPPDSDVVAGEITQIRWLGVCCLSQRV